MKIEPRKIVFVVGPTAVGKTEIGCLLAQKLGGEVISCDSMQVYQEVEIANNKTASTAREKIVHHLLDIVSVEEEFDVARFNTLAKKAIEGIHKRKHVPIIVGGSGLYMQILLDGIFEEPWRNKALGEELRNQAREHGSVLLHNRLQQVDPAAAQKIHPNDLKRILRALEVCLTSEKPISRLQTERNGLWGKYDIRIFGLNRKRNELYQMIDNRVDAMIEQGLIDEVRKLTKLRLSQTAREMIGMNEINGYLIGEYDLEKAKELMKIHTRHLAKRQLTWFNREKRIQWIMIGAGDGPESIAEKIFRSVWR